MSTRRSNNKEIRGNHSMSICEFSLLLVEARLKQFSTVTVRILKL